MIFMTGLLLCTSEVERSSIRKVPPPAGGLISKQ